MSASSAAAHPQASEDAPGHGAGGPAPKPIVVAYGFWIFLISDIVMFSSFFAAYTVLFKHTAGGPGARELFDLHNTAMETGLLLASSFSCGLSSLAVERHRLWWAEAAMLITALLGAGFLALEAREFAGLIARDAGPTRSAFLSSFFTLVGCHGAHVTAGMLWMGTMAAQLWAKGFRADICRRFRCFALFWHALDIVWIAIFSLVYLVGTLPPELLP